MHDAKIEQHTAQASNQKEYSLLMSAAAKGDIKTINSLLSTNTNKIDIHYYDKNGDNAIILAARNNNHNIVVALVDHGADINSTDQNKQSVIFYAISNQNLEMFKFLLEKEEIDLNLEDNKGNTPFIYTAKKVEDLANRGELQKSYKPFFLPCIDMLMRRCKHSDTNIEGKTALQHLKQCIKVDEQEKCLNMLKNKTEIFSNCQLLIKKIVSTVEANNVKLLGRSNLGSSQPDDRSTRFAMTTSSIHSISQGAAETEQNFDKSNSL